MYLTKVFFAFVVVLVLTINLSHAGQKATKLVKEVGRVGVGGVAVNSNLNVHINPLPTNKPSSRSRSPAKESSSKHSTKHK
ncbi:hypothetical protein DOY81_000449 [Sarcophaga bullata]|nr:hypothetical protein DOY81_000449 [Sarcophaga bullata]